LDVTLPIEMPSKISVRCRVAAAPLDDRPQVVSLHQVARPARDYQLRL